MFRLQNHFFIFLALCTSFAACGGSQISDKVARQSDRYYQAASIAWFDENNALAAIRNLTRSIEANPTNDDALYLLGIIRFGRGEYDEAEKHLKQTVKLRENLDPAGLAGAKNNLGLLYIHLKRYEEAIALLKASAEEVMNREPWLAMGNLGWAYIEVGETDKAIEILKRSVFEQPKYCVGRYRLGQAFYQKKDYAQAMTLLSQAIETPETGCDKIQQAHHLLGMVSLRLGEDDQARVHFENCSSINSSTEMGRSCSEAMSGL